MRDPKELIAEHQCRRREDLLARQRTEEQVTVPLELIVRDVIGWSESLKFTPESEIRLGGNARAYAAGNRQYSAIMVEGHDTVRVLKFPGWPPLETGERIRAYVFAGTYAPVNQAEALMETMGRRPQGERILVDRPLYEEESPLRIEKLRADRVVATYWSAKPAAQG